MLKKLVTAINARSIERVNREQGQDFLALELDEVKEIAEKLFERLERKIHEVRALESSVDRKIAALEQLISRADAMKLPDTDRYAEITALLKRGMSVSDIASVLNMPVGEVELILSLKTEQG